MLVYAQVDDYQDAALFRVIEKRKVEGAHKHKVRLQAYGEGENTNASTWTLFVEESDFFYLDAGDSDQERDEYLKQRTDKRSLTHVWSSRSDADTVYHAMMDIGVCGRVSTAPDLLQTRSKSYLRR